ncbi:IS982 family transposase [Acidilutibacter cellobiosedens]|jgi:hypothetical protein|uniref:IS982 family transposase n=1 Tax=Acidilutibacter cellobiosedens TaxID=2507161 RepID=A0A410QG35_9FIRM|nr:IS982 family transposase [Acidilutibacter cellobiosedens]MBE6082701.1 IS982 family transposase [Tissierellaceae bacterium]QAT62889.1 IS982 family transposase [Acidilutibacter cellobiosedens]
MPELHKSYFIKEIENFKDLVIIAYVIIDDIYQEITPTHIKNRRNANDSILSDSEIITISIIGELLTIDSEKAWLGFCEKNFKDLFPKLCGRTRFNRTCRSLHAVIDEIRKRLSAITRNQNSPVRIVDSIPLPVCKFGRAKFHKTFRGYGATYGNCPSKKEIYFGYKLHLLVTLDGFITDFELTSSNTDDRDSLWDILKNYASITVLGDKGYTHKNLVSTLKQEKNIDLIPLKRDNEKVQYSKAFRQLIFKLRRRIETTTSQLTEHLNIERVRAKSLWGLITRIKTKLLAYNLCYYINMLIGRDTNFSRIKALIFG